MLLEKFYITTIDSISWGDSVRERINARSIPNSNDGKDVNIHDIIDSCITNGIINGDELEQKLFPHDESHDVFISHSHCDRMDARSLSRKLAEQGISSFIDSNTWCSVYTALADYQFGDGSRFVDAMKANNEAAHFMLMLNDALKKKISNSRAFVFIEPSNSIRDGSGFMKISSPWIRIELMEAYYFWRYTKKGKEMSKLANFSRCCESFEYTVRVDWLEEVKAKELIRLLK